MSDQTRNRRVALCAFGAVAGVALQGCASSSVVAIEPGEAAAAPVEFRNGERFFKPSLNDDDGHVDADHQEYLFVSSNMGVQPSERGSPIIVQKGDTMYGIARRFRVSLQALIATNNAAPPYTIKVGQTIWLPPPNIHIVEAGETLEDVAERFNVDYRSLAVMNKLPKPYHVSPGDQITLPKLARDFGEFRIATKAGNEQGLASKGPAQPSVSQADSGERVFSDQAITQKTAAAEPPKPKKALAKRTQMKSGPVSAQGFAWPLEGRVLQSFGEQPGGVKNEGLNIAARSGAPIFAAADGRVVYAGSELSDFGNLLLIAHDDNWVTAYAHTSEVFVALGDVVKIGQPIAAVGETGAVGDPQLHFQIRKQKTPMDPITLLPDRAAS